MKVAVITSENVASFLSSASSQSFEQVAKENFSSFSFSEEIVMYTTAQNIVKSLTEREHEVVVVAANEELITNLRIQKPARCFIALQGKVAECGRVQELLDFIDIPYVGSTPQIIKNTARRVNIAPSIQRYRALSGEQGSAWWPRGFVLSRVAYEQWGAKGALGAVEDRIPGGYPIAIKPVCGCLAQGLSKVDFQDALQDAFEHAFQFDDEVLIEQWLEGVSITVAIVGTGWGAHTLPAVEIAQNQEGEKTCYAPIRLEVLSSSEDLAQSIRAEIERSALEAYLACGVKDYGTVDLIWDGAQARILGINTLPGLGEESKFVKACAASGLSLGGILDRLLG